MLTGTLLPREPDPSPVSTVVIVEVTEEGMARSAVMVVELGLATVVCTANTQLIIKSTLFPEILPDGLTAEHVCAGLLGCAFMATVYDAPFVKCAIVVCEFWEMFIGAAPLRLTCRPDPVNPDTYTLSA